VAAAAPLMGTRSPAHAVPAADGITTTHITTRLSTTSPVKTGHREAARVVTPGGGVATALRRRPAMRRRNGARDSAVTAAPVVRRATVAGGAEPGPAALHGGRRRPVPCTFYRQQQGRRFGSFLRDGPAPQAAGAG
jgi:hypothetical protein